MKVTLRCFSTLADNITCDYNGGKQYDLADGKTVDHLIQHAGINKDSIKIAFVNNQKVNFDTELINGDRVALAPVTGGM